MRETAEIMALCYCYHQKGGELPINKRVVHSSSIPFSLSLAVTVTEVRTLGGKRGLVLPKGSAIRWNQDNKPLSERAMDSKYGKKHPLPLRAGILAMIRTSVDYPRGSARQ